MTTGAPIPGAQVPEYARLMQEQMSSLMLRAQKAMEVVGSTDDAKVGQTKKDVVWSRGRTRLYRYRPQAERTVDTPLLLVHSLISRSYILDLYPGGSFAEFLLKRGFDVYLIDWGVPIEADKELTLESYVLDLIPRAVKIIRRDSPTGYVNILGYCMGGLLSAMYVAAHPRAPIEALACLTTPVDFTKMGLFSTWADQRYFDVDALVNRVGNIPAEMLRESFAMLKPASRYSPVQYITLWQNILNDNYVEQYKGFNKWMNEHIPFPGECFRQTVKELQWGNKLMLDTFELGGKPVRLGTIKKPFLHVLGSRDHIVPRESAEPLVEMVGSTDKQQIVMEGGHVGIVAGRSAARNLWPRVADWLAEHSSKVAPEGETEAATAAMGATA